MFRVSSRHRQSKQLPKAVNRSTSIKKVRVPRDLGHHGWFLGREKMDAFRAQQPVGSRWETTRKKKKET